MSRRISPDGNALAIGFGDGTLVHYHMLSGRSRRFAHGGYLVSVAFSPDGSTLASGGQDGSIKLWTAAWLPEASPAPVGPGGVWAVAFSPDGKTLAADEAGGVRLRDAVTGDILAEFPTPVGVLSLAFSPQGELLVSCDDDGAVRFDGNTAYVEGPVIVSNHDPSAIGIYVGWFIEDNGPGSLDAIDGNPLFSGNFVIRSQNGGGQALTTSTSSTEEVDSLEADATNALLDLTLADDFAEYLDASLLDTLAADQNESESLDVVVSQAIDEVMSSLKTGDLLTSPSSSSALNIDVLESLLGELRAEDSGLAALPLTHPLRRLSLLFDLLDKNR